MTRSSDISHYRVVDGGVAAPAGFSASGVSAGLKASGELDLALVVAEKPCPTTAVFTTNKVVAAPVVLSREHVSDGVARAVVINSGNANACTGAGGHRAAERTAGEVAAALDCKPTDVLVCSTGVIGVQLSVDKLVAALPAGVAALSSGNGDAAARAIMTTDTVAKQAAVEFTCGRTTYQAGGMAKGSGMIRPNMATMLAVLTTDAPLTAEACRAALRGVVDVTFNRVTVDSDTSTNDTCVLMASGAGGGEPIAPDDPRFVDVTAAIRAVAEHLARAIARDGEGASHLITVVVRGAVSDADAGLAASAVANSPLVKTAVFGRDANWGRVAMALGKSGCELDQQRLDIVLAGVPVCSAGEAVGFDEDEASAALSADEIVIEADLHLGEGEATVWTCDFTYEYVRINGEYRS